MNTTSCDQSTISTCPTAVAMVVLHDGRVLFGRRTLKAGGFCWQLPGGWIETGESPAAAARRELREETGLATGPLRLIGNIDNGFDRGRRSISAVFEAECVDPDRLTRVEADRSLGWEWHQWDEIIDNLFAPLRRFKKTGYRPPSGSSRAP